MGQNSGGELQTVIYELQTINDVFNDRMRFSRATGLKVQRTQGGSQQLLVSMKSSPEGESTVTWGMLVRVRDIMGS